MSRNCLKPSALFLISCRIHGQLYYLSNNSSITNILTLEKELKYSQIANFLFEVEVVQQYECSIPRKFYEPLLIRHKYSNKYLNFVEQMGNQNHEGCKLALSHQKVRWTVLPCFKYQIKNTQNIEYAERINITQQYYQDSGSKNLFVKEHHNQKTDERSYEFLFGFHFKTEIMFVKFHEGEPRTFHYGQCLKIYHQESCAYLVDSTPASKILDKNQPQDKKWAIAFKNQNEKLGESQLDCVWIVEQATSIKSATNVKGTMIMNTEIRLKNVITGNYLTLEDLSADDQIFKMVGDKEESVYSLFKLEAVKEGDKIITQEVQVRMIHSIIYQYMAVSRYRESHALIDIKMDKIPQDEHFFEFKPISFDQERTVYFLVSLKKELQNISEILSSKISKGSLEKVKKLYLNIQADLKVMEKQSTSYEILKEQFHSFLPLLAGNITQLLRISKIIEVPSMALQIIGLNNHLLIKIAQNDLRNQTQIFKYFHIFLPCLFQQLYVEQLFTQILTNNMKLLSQLSDQNENLQTCIISAIFKNIDIQLKKDKIYWKKMGKIIDLIQVMVKNYDKFIDINQRLIAIELFGKNMLFNQLFFSIKIKKSLFCIHHPTSNIQMPISNYKQPAIRDIIAKVLQLICSLCEDRNIISKKMIQTYLFSDEVNITNTEEKWSRHQDLKFIINCFYIRNQNGLRSKIFLLLANIYIDSYPRLRRYRPVNVMKLDIDNMRITQAVDAASQMAELSSRLKQSIMLKAEKSYYSRPLSMFKTRMDLHESMKNNEEPTFTNNEIVEYKKIVFLLLQTQLWTIQVLKILRLLLNLSIFNSQEKINIYNKIFEKINTYSKNFPIIKELLKILEDLLIFLRQDKLQKVKNYFILMHFKNKTKFDTTDISYIIQSGKNINYDKIKQNPTNQLIITRYNAMATYIHQYEKLPNTIQNVLEVFLKNEYEAQTMLYFIELIRIASNPHNQAISFLFNTSILGQNDLSQFNLLEAYSLQVNNLTQVSEGWLCNNQENSQNYLRFTYLLDQITNFMYQDYVLDFQEGIKYRKKHTINKFRQIIMKNIGLHQYILNLLNISYYLLQGETLRTLKKKIRITLQKCFGFLYQFCYKCEENKDTLFLFMDIISKYINLLQVGQTQLWIHLIKDKKKLIQRVTIQDIQKIIFKIIKDRSPTSNSNCDYNPLYVDQLMTLVDINGKPFKPNIQKIAKILQQPIILKKILYLSEDKKKRNQFCLQLYKLRIDPTQIPVIYHTKLIELLIYMIKQLGNKNSYLRKSFKSLISIDYLFSLTAIDDAFTQQGIPTDMNFVFKIQILKILLIYLSAKGTQTSVCECIQITKFLEYYKNAFTAKQIRKQSMVDNEMLYYSYIQKYENIIQYYLKNSLLFYQQYLKQIFLRLEEIFEQLPNKSQDENYQLLLILLNKNQLLELKKQIKTEYIQRQLQIYMKWSNFTSMSTSPTKQENNAKNILYQLLTSKRTQIFMDQQKRVFFINLQKHEDAFLSRIKSILIRVSQNFQVFNQKYLYKLMFLLYEYIQYKESIPKDIFSRQAPSLVLSDTFKILIIPILKLICLKKFDYNHAFCQKIFHYSLLIIYKILSKQVTLDHHRNILNHLQDENQNGIGFSRCLRTAITQMIEQESIESIYQEINFAQNSLQLLSEEQKIEPLLPSLLLIRELCRYVPFTRYFRGKQIDSFDFLELIYTDLMTIFSQGASKMNIQKVIRIEYLCQTIIFLFNGCNKVNQQMVVNKQFVKQVQHFLKIDLFKQNQDKNTNEKIIINEISSNYRQTIPEYSDILMNQLQYFRFKHFYVTNCVKTSLVKVLLASTISNENSIQKLRIHMSIELLKLNIIILHEQALRYSSKSKEKAFLENFEKWRQVYNNQQQYMMSFTFSTYGFSLIKTLQGELQSSQKIDKNKKMGAQLGGMEHFMPKSMKILLKQLKEEPFFRDILMFYQKYIDAYKYFKETIASIEIGANEQGQIVDITFPRLPICDDFGADKIYDLQYESNRVNQRQTNKSFIILTQKFYKQIQGNIQFNERIVKQYPFSQYLIKIFQNSGTFYTIFCILNLLISLLHLIANFELYSVISTFQSFQDQMFIFYHPKTTIRAILMIFQLANVALCIFFTLFLIIKKMPFYFYLHLQAYHQLDPKEKVGIYKYQMIYGVRNMISAVFMDLFLVFFSALTIIHPVFSTFMLLYLITRLQLGRILIKMIHALYIELLVVIGVLVFFNYCYAIFIYVNLTVGTSYGGECVNLFVCMKLFMDQIIKGGFVTLLPKDYTNNTLTLQLFVQYSYNILVPGVMIEIFRGINFDKMSFFRQKVQSIEQNQKEKCYICGQKQFQIDLVLQGYERHLNITHNRLNYVAFIFYLKRKKRQKYLFYEDLINNCLAQAKYSWIPFETSIRKQKITPRQVAQELFQSKFINILNEKETQARRLLANTKKTRRQINKYLEIPQDCIMNFSPQSPSSPATRSKFYESKQFKSN